MTRSQGHQGGLLGQEKEADEETLRKCKAFLCDIYPTSKKRPQTADELRHITFCQKKQKNETLPSTSNSVQQHNHRVNNQIHIWRCSLDSLQQIPSPVGHGWVIKDGKMGSWNHSLWRRIPHPAFYRSWQLALARSLSVGPIVLTPMSVFPAPRPPFLWQRKHATIHTGYNGRKMMSVILTVTIEQWNF